MEITANELKVLKAITTSEYGSGGYPGGNRVGDAVWTFSVYDQLDMSPQAFAGTVGSLLKKGLVLTNHRYADEDIELTAAGADAAGLVNGCMPMEPEAESYD